MLRFPQVKNSFECHFLCFIMRLKINIKQQGLVSLFTVCSEDEHDYLRSITNIFFFFFKEKLSLLFYILNPLFLNN